MLLKSGRRRVVALGGAVLSALLIGFFLLPVIQIDSPVCTVLTDQNGQLIGATIAKDEQWRFPPTDEVPPKFTQAILQYEDQRFFWHPGIDPLAIARAIRLNWNAGTIVSGASTLTMQVARIAGGNQERTYKEKSLEALLALRLEVSASKNTILAMYAHNAPFGGNIVGLEAAAWRYFGRSPQALSWAESATLAVLPNNPAMVHPGRNRETLLKKRDRLLDALRDEGHITDLDCTLAKAEPLLTAPVPIPQKAPHLLFSARANNPDHTRIQTSLDRTLQDRTTEVVNRHHQQLAGNGVHNAAALIVEIETGQVLAYVGNIPNLRNAEHQNYVDIIPSRRSTGSLLKPFLYGALLQEGELLPEQIIPDVPIRIGGFSPENFDQTYDGAIPANNALARSRNVPAVRMLQQYGVDRFYGTLKRLGMSTLNRSAANYGLTLVLGGAEGTLWEMVSLYRNLAWSANHSDNLNAPWQPMHWSIDGPQSGQHIRPNFINPGAAWLALDALLEVNRPGIHGGWESYSSTHKVAWKTGTSHGFRDAWAIGLTPQYGIGVWVGNADGEGRPGLTGFQAAAPILFDLVDLIEHGEWFYPPYEHVVQADVCTHSGMRAGPHCPSQLEWVPKASLRSAPCDYCRVLHCDGDCDFQIHANCDSIANIHNEPWFVLPPAMEWFYQRAHTDYKAPPPLRSDCREDQEVTPPISCLYPNAGSKIYVPIELDGTRGRVVFSATHREPDGRIFWHLDDQFVGVTADIHQMALAPKPGPHRLTLVDHTGSRIQRRFTVLDKPK